MLKTVSILLMWGFAAFFYFYENILQVLPSVMRPELSEAFGLNGAQFGHLSAVCLYAYGLMQIPVGIFSDRFQAKYILSGAALLCAVGCLLFASAKTLFMAEAGRLLMGLGGSFAFISTVKLATNYFAAQWIALLIGITVTLGFLGSVLGLSWGSHWMEIFSWRKMLVGCSAGGFVLAIVLWLLIAEEKQVIHTKQTIREILRELYSLCRRTELWMAALYGCLMFVPTQIFGSSWGVPFLCEAHGFERASAGLYSALIYVGWMVGGPLWGWISSRFNQCYSILGCATVLTFLLSLMMIASNSLSSGLAGLLLFGIGFFSSAYLLIFAVIQGMTSVQFSGIALGVANAVSSLSALADPLLGKILDTLAASFRGAVTEYVFNIGEYQVGLLLIPVFLILSLCFLFYQRPAL